MFRVAFALVLLATPVAAETIPANKAASHVGQTVTIEGIATDVTTSRGGTTFIDVDGKYPNQAFVAVIFKGVPNMGDLTTLTGKTVDITGTITLYNGKPEIVVTAREQIK